jgi:hypothetical protein
VLSNCSKVRETNAETQEGFKSEDVLKLYKFLDWTIQMPEQLEKQFNETVAELVATDYLKSATRNPKKKNSRRMWA